MILKRLQGDESKSFLTADIFFVYSIIRWLSADNVSPRMTQGFLFKYYVSFLRIPCYSPPHHFAVYLRLTVTLPRRLFFPGADYARGND